MLILYSQILSTLPREQLNQALSCLPSPMQEKALRYRRWQDVQAYVLGKLLLVEALACYGLDLTLNEIRYNSFNRPYFQSAVDFNISHSGDYVICALSQHTKVGIDLEEIRPVNLTDFQGQWTESEWTSILFSPNPLNTFYTYWTQKEAVMKADGRGLSIPLQEIKLEGCHARVANTYWYIKRIALVEGYITHLVTEMRLEQIFPPQRFTIGGLIRNQSFSMDKII